MEMSGTEFVLTLRTALARLHNEAAAFLQGQGGDPAAGSQAAAERATFPRPESLYTVAAVGTMLVESVGEHVSALVKLMTEPVEPIACWTCVRSMLESAAIAAWLFDPRIDAERRVGRAYGYRYEGLEEQAKFGRAVNLPPAEVAKAEGLLDRLERDAAALGYSVVTDRNGRRIGVAERMPSATDIIKLMLDEEGAYRLLSATAHGHTWAIQQLGFRPAAVQPPAAADGVQVTAMEKSSGSVAGYAFLVLRAAKALARPLWNQCVYFGWDRARLAAVLESVYDEFAAQPALRFWR